MGTFSGIKKEVDTIVRLRIDKTINKMKLVKRDEFEILKKMVQKLAIENDNLKKTNIVIVVGGDGFMLKTLKKKNMTKNIK